MANHRWDTEPPAALPSRLALRRRAAGLGLGSPTGAYAAEPWGRSASAPEIDSDDGPAGWQLQDPDSAEPEFQTGPEAGSGVGRRWRFPLRAGILAACLMLAAAAAVPILRDRSSSEVLSVELGSSLATGSGESGLQGQEPPETGSGESAAEADTARSGAGSGGSKSRESPEGTGSEDAGANTGEAGPDGASGDGLVVHVAGAVAVPGLVRISAGGRVADAVAAAGGATGQADLTRVNLAAPMTDGSMVVVPAKGDPPTGPAAAPAPGSAVPAAPGTAAGVGSGDSTATVNLNTAGESELQNLPRVGPVLAARIIAWRTEHGPFQRVEDLDAVPGIGEAMLAALLPLVAV